MPTMAKAPDQEPPCDDAEAALPVIELSDARGREAFERLLERLSQTTSATSEQAATVREVVEAVAREGDEAVVRFMRRWTDRGFSTDRIVVSPSELESARAVTPEPLEAALRQAIDHVESYQRHILPSAPPALEQGGARLGLRFTPVDRVGLLVPGGKAAYPSSVVMLAVPALAAGVRPENIVVVSPPPTRATAAAGKPTGDRSTSNSTSTSTSTSTSAAGSTAASTSTAGPAWGQDAESAERPGARGERGAPDAPAKSRASSRASRDTPAADVAPLVLAACRMLGLSRVMRIGGAQAVAALAFGTDSVPAVDLIVGPGNIYTQLAKQQLSGRVGVDGFLGPSEIVTLADESADPDWIAADLIAQAEHDPGKCVLVTWRRDVLEAVLEAIERSLPHRSRREAIERALQQESAAVLASGRQEAIEAANRLAPEHLNLAVRQPERTAEQIRSAGEIFLGHQSPVATGDYFAGPSHCLPTGRTARFASGVSVYTFLKRTGTVHYRQGVPADAADPIVRLAEAEGLEAHAASVAARRERGG